MNLDNEKSSKGKFFGYLICTDCDGTLTYDIGKVSEKNVRAIKYFQSEGGLFTLATGRFPNHLEMFKGQFEINAPMASLNGTLLYDTKNNKPIKTWTVSSKKCLNMINGNFGLMVLQVKANSPVWVISLLNIKKVMAV